MAALLRIRTKSYEIPSSERFSRVIRIGRKFVSQVSVNGLVTETVSLAIRVIGTLALKMELQIY